MIKTIYSNEYLTICKVVNDRFIDSLPTQNRPAVFAAYCTKLYKNMSTLLTSLLSTLHNSQDLNVIFPCFIHLLKTRLHCVQINLSFKGDKYHFEWVHLSLSLPFQVFGYAKNTSITGNNRVHRN